MRIMRKEKKVYALSSNASTASDEELSSINDAAQISGPVARRRASRTGTRCVSALSSDQLARKRANDREAQRAIRQRAKEHIENLEHRIQELTGGAGDDAIALADAQQRNTALERELNELRTKLARLESNSSPYGAWHFDVESSAITVLHATDSNISQSHSEHRGSFDSCHAPAPLAAASADILGSTAEQDFKPGLGQNGAVQTTSPAIHDGWVENGAPNSPTFNPGAPYDASMNLFPASSNTTPFAWLPSSHYWELPIRYLPPTGIIDTLLITLLQEQRRCILQGTLTLTRLTSPANMRSLLYCEPSSTLTLSDPVSNTIAEILHDTRMPSLPERAASLFVMHKLLCWQISPLPETYDRIPDWFLPRPSQLVEPHPLWVSQIPWPKLRDKVILNQMDYSTEEFRVQFVASISVNWPYSDIDVLMFENGEVRVTPMFESHVMKLENWTLNAPFVTRYPELADVCKFGNTRFAV